MNTFAFFAYRLSIAFLFLSGVSLPIFGQSSDTSLAYTFWEQAKMWQDASQNDSALVQYERAAAAFLESDYPHRYIQCLTQKGQLLINTNALTEARNHLKETLREGKQLLEKNANSIADVHFQMSRVNYYLDQMDSAIADIFQAMAIKKNLYGEESEQVAFLYTRLSAIYVRLSDYSKAEVYERKGYEIRRRIFPEIDHRYQSPSTDWLLLSATKAITMERSLYSNRRWKSIRSFLVIIGTSLGII